MKIWLDMRDRKAISFTDATAILQDIARASDVEIQPRLDGLAVSTRLYPAASKRWQRVSLSPFGENKDGTRRKVAAVCWHGHYRFMSEVFARFPHAKITTGHATYNGRTQFFTDAEATGDVDRGAPIAPMAFRDACTCTDPGDADYLVYDALQRPENDTPERAAQRAAEGTPWSDSPLHAFNAPDAARVLAGVADADACDDCGETEDHWKHNVNEVVELGTCQWFAICENDATHLEPHTILGSVPACDRCPKVGM